MLRFFNQSHFKSNFLSIIKNLFNRIKFNEDHFLIYLIYINKYIKVIYQFFKLKILLALCYIFYKYLLLHNHLFLIGNFI